MEIIRNYNIFFISDTHFSHQNSYKFYNYDGTKMRPWDNAEEADEIMIENWNKMVKPNDHIYHLGDVGFNRNKLDLILPRLNGHKVLIKGNHDNFKPNFYLKYFKDIRGCHNRDNLLLTHIPVHESSKGRFKANIHGHVHGNSVEDSWYINVCVEAINYMPISYDDIINKIQQ